jgi:hypothetical protein
LNLFLSDFCTGNINGQNLQGNTAPALSQNAIIGIAVGGTLGLLVLIVLVTPCIYAVARKDDPRIQRMTNRFTNAFGSKLNNFSSN